MVVGPKAGSPRPRAVGRATCSATSLNCLVTTMTLGYRTGRARPRRVPPGPVRLPLSDDRSDRKSRCPAAARLAWRGVRPGVGPTGGRGAGVDARGTRAGLCHCGSVVTPRRVRVSWWVFKTRRNASGRRREVEKELRIANGDGGGGFRACGLERPMEQKSAPKPAVGAPPPWGECPATVPPL